MDRRNIDDGVKVAVHRAFDGRKGHGGKVPITKRVFDREHLERFGHGAVQRTLDFEQMRTCFCESKSCPGYSYKASELPHPPETCNDREVDPSVAVLRQRARNKGAS